MICCDELECSSPLSFESEDLDAGIYDVADLPAAVHEQLAEAKMRFAIWHTIPEGSKLNLCILPSTVIMVPPRHHIFINNITDDMRAYWLLRGVDRSSVGEVCRKTEVTRFCFNTRGENDAPRKVFLFVRVYPPHFVELGIDKRDGKLSVRIEQIADGFGDTAELSIAVGEEES
jgi:hypothetical protein